MQRAAERHIFERVADGLVHSKRGLVRRTRRETYSLEPLRPSPRLCSSHEAPTDSAAFTILSDDQLTNVSVKFATPMATGTNANKADDPVIVHGNENGRLLSIAGACEGRLHPATNRLTN